MGMHIGGTDSPVVRDPHTQDPYIPGSSLKGKVRSLLELQSGLMGVTDGKPLSFQDLAAIEGDEKEFSDGYFIFVPQGVRHSFRNTGDGRLRFICVVPNR